MNEEYDFRYDAHERLSGFFHQMAKVGSGSVSAIVKVAILLLLFGSLVSCTKIDYNSVARTSEPLRILLARYYQLNGHFPDDLNLLNKIDPRFTCRGGFFWNRWDYTSFDPNKYNLWIYPDKWSRQSLWLKFDTKAPSDTGWFINNDNGVFKRQNIPLLPRERDLLR